MAGYLKKQDGTLIELVDAKARQDIEEIKENGVGSKITKLSELTDDLGDSPVHTHSQYLTEHQDISNKADKSEVYTKEESDQIRNEQIKVNGSVTEDTQILINVNGEEVEIPTIDDLNELKSNTIFSIQQTVTSTESNGVNEITVAKGNGETSTLEIRNGAPGHFGKLVYDDETGNMYVEDSEAEYAKKSDIPDVRIKGESIVVDGVANIPVPRYHTTNEYTLLRVTDWSGLITNDNAGSLAIRQIDNINTIKNRNSIYTVQNNGVITPYNFDQTVKHALCDVGTGSGDQFGRPLIYTAEEQQAARERLGIYCITQSEYDSLVEPKGIYIIKED